MCLILYYFFYVSNTTGTAVNAFTILMNSARQLASCTMPQEIDEPKTGKQKLWNSVITFLNKGGHVWRGSEVDNNGVAFVRALVDTLWTIDGHHDTLCSRSYPIPDM